MLRLAELAKQAIVPLVVSAAIGGYNILQEADRSKTLLKQNIEVTSELSKAVNDLRFQMAIFQEKYVTREELERKLGVANGPRTSYYNQPVGGDKPPGDRYQVSGR